jgi:hypothetical protein
MATDGDTTERVYTAVMGLVRETGQPADRSKIFLRAGVSDVVGNDRLRALADSHRLVRTGRGLYRPAHVFPPDEEMDFRCQPTGMTKFVKGGVELEFTPSEMRTMARMVGNWATT